MPAVFICALERLPPQRLIQTWRLFVSYTNGKILVPISQGN